MTIDIKNMKKAIVGFYNIAYLTDVDKEQMQTKISVFINYAIIEKDYLALEELVNLAKEIGKQEYLDFDLLYDKNTNDSIYKIIEQIKTENFIYESRGE